MITNIASFDETGQFVGWNRGFPIRDEAGEIHHYINIALDITADRKNRRRLANAFAVCFP